MHTIRNKQGGHTDADFWTQYGSVNPRQCLMLKITPKDDWAVSNDAVGFTSNSRDMTLPGHAGITFKSTPGISPTLIEQALDSATNVELMGIYRSLSLDQAEVLAGKWDYARCELFVVCWDDTDLGEFLVHDGFTGEFKDYQSYFVTETRGKMAKLSNEVGIATAKRCRVKEFRDAECGHTAAQVTISGTAYNIEQTLTVASITNDFTIVFTKLAGTANDVPANFFASGKITANTTTIDLGQISREIYQSATATNITITLRRKFPFTVSIGDTFDLVAGCNRTVEDCMKYSNIINFRGEPYIPGIESANRVNSVG